MSLKVGTRDGSGRDGRSGTPEESGWKRAHEAAIIFFSLSGSLALGVGVVFQVSKIWVSGGGCLVAAVALVILHKKIWGGEKDESEGELRGELNAVPEKEEGQAPRVVPQIEEPKEVWGGEKDESEGELRGKLNAAPEKEGGQAQGVISESEEPKTEKPLSLDLSKVPPSPLRQRKKRQQALTPPDRSNIEASPSRSPKLPNKGKTCFMNAALQGLMCCFSYRDGIIKMIKREGGYYASWDKLCKAIGSKTEEKWTEEELKGVLICLARSSLAKIEGTENQSFLGWLFGYPIASLKKTPFEPFISSFERAITSNQEWPSIEEGFGSKVNQWICQGQKMPRDIVTYHPKRQEAFRVLLEVFNSYTEGREISWRTPLECLHVLMGSSEGEQQDVAEFVLLGILDQIRSCEFPDLGFSKETQRVLQEYTTDDPQKLLDLSKKRENVELDAAPIGFIQRKEIRGGLSLVLNIRDIPCDGQSLLDALSRGIPTTLSEEEKLESLLHYKEGSYYIKEEREILTTFPTNLMIQLMRFDRSGKIGTKINFKEELQIQDQRYKVVAIAQHIGDSRESGHYVALSLNSDGMTWSYCDDDDVHQASKKEYRRCFNYGYLYFLEKI